MRRREDARRKPTLSTESTAVGATAVHSVRRHLARKTRDFRKRGYE